MESIVKAVGKPISFAELDEDAVEEGEVNDSPAVTDSKNRKRRHSSEEDHLIRER